MKRKFPFEIERRAVWLILLLLPMLLLAACGDENEPEETDVPPAPTLPPSPEVVMVPSNTPGGPTLTPSATFPATVTPHPTDLPAAVQPTATQTPPPPPYITTIAANDTCGSIAVRFGLDVVSGARAIIEANGLNERCTNLPGVGSRITVPRPTLTPTQPGFDVTQTHIATLLPTALRHVTPYQLYEYCPREGDTLNSIALSYGTTNKRICELNPLPDGIDCGGCDFSQSAVGFCPVPPIISEFNCLNVPGPTHTPTFTATFSGSETPTPTPTYLPPRPIFPVNESTITGPVELIWLSVGELKEGEMYVVSIQDEGSSELIDIEATRTPNYAIPAIWQPAAGQTRTVIWSVDVSVMNPNTGAYEPVSGRSFNARFIWEGN